MPNDKLARVPNRRRDVIRAVLCITALSATFALLRPALVNAYDQWSTGVTTGNCATCHGDFRAANYISASDGVAWNTSLHDGHRNSSTATPVGMLNRDCNACHFTSRFPVSLSASAGGTGLSPIGCAGCHGRAEPAAGGAVTGAGLRQHHWRAGEQGCGAAGCHADANPANFQTAGENVAPPYYFTPDANHPNKPTSACNTDGSESRLSQPRGLDNNGNGLYDNADPTCGAAGVDPGAPTTGLRLEGARPNPATSDMRVWFTLANSRPATLELLDISGRRVVQRDVTSLGAGRHAMDMNPGAPLRPGVYLLRLVQDGRTLTSTAIVRQ